MRLVWLVFLSAALASACSSSSSSSGTGGSGGMPPGTGGAGGDGGSGGSPPLVYPTLECDSLAPEVCGYPFPSNVFTEADESTVTGRRVALSQELFLGNDPSYWNRSDGFSTGSPIITFFPGIATGQFAGVDDIDASLAPESPTIVLDVETGELVPHFAQIDMRAPTAEQRSTMIRPVVRLRDNARYIVAFRNLRNEDGDLIEPSPAFAALRDGTSSEDESVEARRALYEDIFERLEDEGWATADIQLAWDFNTASDENNTEWLVHMRDTAFELVADGIEYTIKSVESEFPTNPTRDENIAFRVRGTYRVPNFMTSVEPGSFLVFGDDGLPMVNEEVPWMDVPFDIMIPKSASAETPAAIIEYGHGLLGSARQIDASHFATFMNEYNYIFAATNLIGMSGEDETAIGISLATGNVAALQTMFDRLHQGFVNYVVLLRMMKTTFAEDETFGQYVKADEAYYYGISQGGIMGSVVTALSPDIERGALGVMGQPYSFLLFRSVDFNRFLEIIKMPFPDFRDQQFLVTLIQMTWDRVEPNGYTHHIRENPLPGTNTKEVLTRVAIGDHQVTNYAAHIMARTLKAPHLTTGLRTIWGLDAVESTTGGSFYTEYDFDVPGEPFCNLPQWLCNDPHEYPRRREAARKQLDEFLRQGTGTNHCMPGDGDEHDAVGEGVCSYPSLSGCESGETEEDTEALCVPGALPPQD